ncbi:MAG: serine/threonine protein kinase, partial [Acidobacteria bacterium]|nr:serine/threonine protein kinase [Acidobacteriota bacterium]
MGAIYKVRHRLLDEIRVIKVMRPHTVADADLKRRFIEEAKTATRLKHPNLCTIHDFAVEDNGTGYLVMEFIDGVPVGDLLKQGDLPNFTLTLEIAHQALQALSYLHKKSIVHRDIAPDNLMLLYEEDKPKIKLIDLGIAKAMDKPADQSKTVAGTFLGKLGYASPELFGALPEGELLDGRSDLYSLGIVMYELLTGRRPVSSDQGPAGWMRAHLLEPPLPFEKSDPGHKVPDDVRELVMRALTKRREDRYATADDFDAEIIKVARRYL